MPSTPPPRSGRGTWGPARSARTATRRAFWPLADSQSPLGALLDSPTGLLLDRHPGGPVRLELAAAFEAELAQAVASLGAASGRPIAHLGWRANAAVRNAHAWTVELVSTGADRRRMRVHAGSLVLATGARQSSTDLARVQVCNAAMAARQADHRFGPRRASRRRPGRTRSPGRDQQSASHRRRRRLAQCPCQHRGPARHARHPVDRGFRNDPAQRADASDVRNDPGGARRGASSTSARRTSARGPDGCCLWRVFGPTPGSCCARSGASSAGRSSRGSACGICARRPTRRYADC